MLLEKLQASLQQLNMHLIFLILVHLIRIFLLVALLKQ